MAKKKASKKTSGTKKVGLGIGLTAAAVSAAGAYFLYGSKNASKNRRKVKGWALKAKGEVLEALEKAQSITEDEYHNLVESAVGAYGTLKNASSGEVRDFKREMMDHWNTLQRSKAVRTFTSPRKTTKRVKRKTTRKVTKKSKTRAPRKRATKQTKKSTTKKTTRRKK